MTEISSKPKSQALHDAAVSSENPVAQDAASGLENTEIILDKKDSKGGIIIGVACDKLKACLQVTACSSEELFSAEEILTIISSTGITAPVNKEAIIKGLSCLKKEGDTTVFILLGQGPVPGKDGEYEILYPQDNPFVEKGQLLIRIKEATPGSAGQNIYGASIESGSVKIPAITAGDNVLQGKDFGFYSNLSGKVTFTNNVLAVHKVLDIKVSSDQMEAVLTCKGAEKLTLKNIQEEILAHKITSGIDEHALDEAVAACSASATDQIKSFVIARGIAAKQGRDGEIKYLFHKGKGINLHEHVEDGVIIQGPNVITSVEKGAEIAFILPAEEPVPGKDIFGKTVPVFQRVKKATLRPGKSVKVSADGLHFFAEATGLPVVEGDKISISDVLILGSLDYKVGNIDFDGMVEIHGDVADGFKVKASKTIIIKGVAGACDLEAGLDILIEGGCNGQKKSRIICGGNLKAKYLDEVHVHARGDILVKNEMVDSNISCLGRVQVKSGAIYGGSIKAKRGIESYDIGNDMGIKTKLMPGDDFELNEEIKKLEEDIAQKNIELVNISKKIAPLLKDKEGLSKLPEEVKQKLKETIAYLSKLRQDRDSLNQSKEELLVREIKDAVPEIVVHHYVFAGALLKIGKTRRQISSLLEGPLRFYEENELISVEPYSKK
ncbi:MAG: FapA family protein [Pseudomonadota bacterium]